MFVNKSITLTLTEEEVNMVNEALATRGNKTFEQVVHQCFTMGVKQLNYRTERNRENYASFKEWRASNKK